MEPSSRSPTTVVFEDHNQCNWVLCLKIVKAKEARVSGIKALARAKAIIPNNNKSIATIVGSLDTLRQIVGARDKSIPRTKVARARRVRPRKRWSSWATSEVQKKCVGCTHTWHKSKKAS